MHFYLPAIEQLSIVTQSEPTDDIWTADFRPLITILYIVHRSGVSTTLVKQFNIRIIIAAVMNGTMQAAD